MVVLYVILFCLWTMVTSSSHLVSLGHHSTFIPRRNLVLPEGRLVHCRNVPGDGACLFHALAACLSYKRYNQHFEFGTSMRTLSKILRKTSVDVLKTPNQTLYVESDEVVSSDELLKLVASHYNMSTEEYCSSMQDLVTWGGGPEIVALSNFLNCSIHVYELVTAGSPFKKTFAYKRMAKFGPPGSDKDSRLHILFADGRYPDDVRPGQQQALGDHFYSIFHEEEEEEEEEEGEYVKDGGGDKLSLSKIWRRLRSSWLSLIAPHISSYSSATPPIVTGEEAEEKVSALVAELFQGHSSRLT